MKNLFHYNAIACGVILLAGSLAQAAPVYQPPGSNLVYGDVTHGGRIQSASSNPAAAAADLARGSANARRGTVLSGAAGLEYGNVQNIFDFIDAVAAGYEPSDPGSGGGGPGQDPGDKPGGGIDIDEILDNLDPDFVSAVEAAVDEAARQAVILALIASEGYGKAWLAADAPFVMGSEHWGGAWTFGMNWSGGSKAFGLKDEIRFDFDDALMRLEDWFNTLPLDRPVQFELSDDVLMLVEPTTNALRIIIDNDSSIVSKSSQLTEFNAGYSRQAWSNSAGNLYLGAEAKLYLMKLSRLSVRFGDITDSEELFRAINDAEFSEDTRMGIDLGALWVGNNYQLGAQITNVNEPNFEFPAVDLGPYSNLDFIDQIQRDQSYKMNRQLKLEASLFSTNGTWSTHLGIDANASTDPLGDDYQWATLSAGFRTESWWLPGARFGYRKNLAGTGLSYLGIGLTAFKIVNFDISSALETVEIDGTTLPRGLMASIGFQITW